MARCPAHDDSTPSLSISEAPDGKLLVHCHAGCSQAAVIDALRAANLWPTGKTAAGGRISRRTSPPRREHSLDDRARLARAMQIWCAARTAVDSPAAIYLQSRGITLSPPKTLRFHGNLRHKSGATLPALVALVTTGGDDRPVGIHRTFLTGDGRGKAPIKPNKMLLGPCRGGAVRLAAARQPLLIGEGIETCLSAMQKTGFAAWAALSASAMRTLELPRGIRQIILLADGDRPGQTAARAAAMRWRCQGRFVRIAQAPDGMDFNDLLRLEQGDLS